jgi:hypothetical protein
MKKAVGSTLIVAQFMVFWFALAQTETSSPAPTDLRAASDQPGPVITVSPDVLDFGLVGVKRSKALLLTVRNVGGGTLKGKATVAQPFSFVEAKTYSLQGGQSQEFVVQYRPTAEGTNRQSLVFSGGSTATVLVTGYARTPPQPPRNLRVVTEAEVKRADFIVRYNDDRTSYVVKPPKKDEFAGGDYYSIYDRGDVLKLAAAQPGRELAIVVIAHYPTSASEEPAKLAWVKDLQSLGYKGIIFCWAANKVDRIIGLEVRDGPQATKLRGAG